MKTKAGILITLIVAVVALIIVTKGVKTEKVPDTSGMSISKSAILIEQAKDKSQPAWLLFHSKTCQSCIEMEGIFNALKPEFEGKIAFINIDVNDPNEQELCSQYQIQYIPTTYFLNSKGEKTFNYVGVIKEEEMKAKLKALVEGQ